MNLEGATEEGTSPRVFLALSNSGDRDLLARTIGHMDVDVVDFREDGLSPSGVDLLIVDHPHLDQFVTSVRRLRAQSEPVLLPVLLLAAKQSPTPAQLESLLSDIVDDVVRLPTTAPELRARVSNLLRLRRHAKSQYRGLRQTQQALSGVNRALRILNACNEVILRQDTERGLLSAVCEVLTDSEGYELAWAGFPSPEKTTEFVIEKHALSGRATGFAEEVNVRWDESATGLGPTGRALATGHTQIMPDLLNDERARVWLEQLQAWGLRAAISLPLLTKIGANGVLSVYSGERGDFEVDEQRLLERLAANVSFALDSLRTKKEREEQAAEIRELAFNDSLTHLPNRRYLLKHLEHIVAAESPTHAAAILFIDLNDFKLVNDALGHAAGDSVLVAAARRLEQTVREEDLVARQGGDEFIVVMVDKPRDEAPGQRSARHMESAARSLAERIVGVLQAPFEVAGYRHRLSASIGVSMMPFNSGDAETVIDQADTAMYEAKQGGEPIAFFAPEMSDRRTHRLSLEAKLHRALEAEELELHYQPIWCVQDGRMVGVEALLRWTDEDDVFISPGEFIPVAEEIGLIGPISEWVLHTAARQLAIWRAGSLPLSMSVNLSASQLSGKDAAEHIRSIAEGEHTDPAWWCLELTEEILMRDPGLVSEAMNVLNDYGFKLALDDFGRGYSSMARLQALPLHTLKIDKLFVDQIFSSARGEAIVRAIIDVAGHLSLTALAEGVESEDQRRRLADLGCSLGQGFWFGPAVPGAEIADLAVRAASNNP